MAKPKPPRKPKQPKSGDSVVVKLAKIFLGEGKKK